MDAFSKSWNWEVLAVTGPTASGKSQLAAKIANELDSEVINCDSVQLYRDFNIGAAKPCAEILSLVPHRLLSQFSADNPLDAWSFSQAARTECDRLISAGKTPILAGGTGLYLSAILSGLMEHAPILAEHRQRLEQLEQKILSSGRSLADENGLHAELAGCDPDSAKVISPNDLTRIRRALLVCWASGQAISELRRQHQHRDANYNSLILVLLPAREQLYARIDQRVIEMFNAGLVEEVQKLTARYGKSNRILGSIGYQQVTERLEQGKSEVEMIEAVQQETRRYAKRQYTWWKNRPKALGWTVLGEVKLGASFFDLGVVLRALRGDISPDNSRVLFEPSGTPEASSPAPQLNGEGVYKRTINIAYICEE